MGTLSDRQIRHRLGLDNITADGRELIPIPRDHPNRLEVEPFAEMTREPGHPSYGLSAYGIDLRAGRQWMYLDLHELAARGNRPLRPGDKGLPWVTKEAAPGELIIVPPRSAILCQTLERVRIPRDCWGFVLGKSTWARLFVDLNTTMIEPEWEGYITLEVTNNGACAVGIEPGEGICQLVLHRGDRPELWPLGRSYADRTDTAYQGQTGVTPPRT